MLRRVLSVAVVGLAIFLVGFYAGRAKTTTVYAQGRERPARVGVIPKAWGSFKASAGLGGAVFEDSNGTIRIVDYGEFIDTGGVPTLVATLNRQ